STIILTAGETKSIYVFASPPFNTPKGEYDLKVTVSGEYSSATADLVVDVYPVGGLGQQVPDFESGDYAVDLQLPSALDFEDGTAKKVTVTVKNTGLADLHEVMVFFQNDLLQLYSEQGVAPFDLAGGEEKTLSFELVPLMLGDFNSQARVVSGEGIFSEKDVTVSITPKTVSVSLASQTQVEVNGVKKTQLVFDVANSGDATLNAVPSLKGVEDAEFGAQSLAVAPGETKQLVVLTSGLSEGEEKPFVLLLDSERGVYSLEGTAVYTQPSSLSGLFTAAAPIALFGFIVLIALLALYYFVFKKPHQEEKAVEEKPVKKPLIKTGKKPKK
ncbi:MAG: hypothetical protein V1834_01600, partial [Candidatus Micrarchaeota archaeon]